MSIVLRDGWAQQVCVKVYELHAKNSFEANVKNSSELSLVVIHIYAKGNDYSA